MKSNFWHRNHILSKTHQLTLPASTLTPSASVWTLSALVLSQEIRNILNICNCTRERKSQEYQGGLEIAGEGTFVFNIQSDDGIIDTIRIPKSLYVPGIKLPLLSPQHWAETAGDNAPIKFGTKIEADEEGCTLLWKQQTRRKRITHDPLTKTPIFRTAPGTQ